MVPPGINPPEIPDVPSDLYDRGLTPSLRRYQDIQELTKYGMGELAVAFDLWENAKSDKNWRKVVKEYKVLGAAKRKILEELAFGQRKDGDNRNSNMLALEIRRNCHMLPVEPEVKDQKLDMQIV